MLKANTIDMGKLSKEVKAVRLDRITKGNQNTIAQHRLAGLDAAN
ncbi:MAG: hypothetical protein AAFW67_05500 [Cyanobacteria bacterium J06638_38]